MRICKFYKIQIKIQKKKLFFNIYVSFLVMTYEHMYVYVIRHKRCKQIF